MKELMTYNFEVKLEYLDECKSTHPEHYYIVLFQVLAEDKYNARKVLEKWLENPKQTGWKYKTWVGISPKASSSIIVDEKFLLTDEDGYPIT